LALSNFMLAEISSHTPRVFITGQILWQVPKTKSWTKLIWAYGCKGMLLSAWELWWASWLVILQE
jgi:hypothetical protein